MGIYPKPMKIIKEYSNLSQKKLQIYERKTNTINKKRVFKERKKFLLKKNKKMDKIEIIIKSNIKIPNQ